MSWNVAKTNYDAVWVRDYQQIVEAYQPDVICLQEVQLDADSRKLAAIADMGWQFAPNFKNAFADSYCGVLIGAKAGCIRHRALLSDHSEPIANTPKASIFSEFEIVAHSGRLMVVSVHAINFVPLAKFEAQMAAIAAELEQHQGPIVLAGDFNTWSQRRWQSLCNMTQSLGLTPVTFPSADRSYLKRFLLSPPLDHVFYRGFKQVPGEARVIDKPLSSDHNPLFAALEL